MSAFPPHRSDRLPTDARVRRAARARLITGAVALTALAVCGAVSIAVGGRPAPDGSTARVVEYVATSVVPTTSTTSTTPSTPTSSIDTSTTTTTTTSIQAPPTPSPVDKLYSVLPPGYNSTLCGPSDSPSPQALATVDCGRLDQANGPTSARFSLFADANALASQFQDGVNATAASQCPGSIDSPRSWHYDATPAFSAGSLVCGTHNGVPDLMWTKNDVLLLGDVQGSSLDDLYGWWLSLG